MMLPCRRCRAVRLASRAVAVAFSSRMASRCQLAMKLTASQLADYGCASAS